MDRRDALKKLGVGGAVAVAGPVLLDSFNVANAASPYPSASAVASAAGPGSLTPSGHQLTFGSIGSLFTSPVSFAWTDAAAAAPILQFSPSNAANTTISTPSNPKDLRSWQFTALLTVDGIQTYQFFWNGSSLSVT